MNVPYTFVLKKSAKQRAIENFENRKKNHKLIDLEGILLLNFDCILFFGG
jgi:hypothetical protein